MQLLFCIDRFSLEASAPSNATQALNQRFVTANPTLTGAIVTVCLVIPDTGPKLWKKIDLGIELGAAQWSHGLHTCHWANHPLYPMFVGLSG